ncbi:MAG TPA: DUF2917 domain-containing protein [Paraburkholderia sp.]|nr:DUF2917 domain-containing protein [Paraburkholderia sp.]
MQADEANTESRREELRIARGSCRLVRHVEGGVLAALEGRVLMTVEGDAQDYWLEAGEALPFAPGERVWVGGWDEAVRCEVRTPPAPWGETRALVLLGWLARLSVGLPARLLKRPAPVRMRALRG